VKTVRLNVDLAGQTVGETLCRWLNALRAELGSWQAVSRETGLGLSTVRFIRQRVRARFGWRHPIKLTTFNAVEAALKRVLGPRVQPGRPGPFIPRLAGVEA